jgi:hypothetical protein
MWYPLWGEDVMMMRWMAALLLLVPTGVASVAAAGKQCSYAWKPFADGSVSCQGGRQFRCADGAWQDVGTTCADADPADEGVRVRPGVNEPTVKDPSVRQPGTPGVPQVDQPPTP